VAVHVPGRVQERRGSPARRSGSSPPAARRVLLEACGSAHQWGRELQRLGHTVRLLPAGDVARYRAGNKTDRADAKALLEAARNDKISRVPVKSVEQQAVVALHRIRQGYLQTRTARINAVRGHLREFGCVVPVGAAQVLPGRMPRSIRTPCLSCCARPQIVLEEIAALETHRGGPDCADPAGRADARRPGAAHGPGGGHPHRWPSSPSSATSTASARGDFAAYLGLTPRELPSGPVRRLGAITKRGNSYVRMLLIHGARSALRAGTVTPHPDDLRT
jgi:transposase